MSVDDSHTLQKGMHGKHISLFCCHFLLTVYYPKILLQPSDVEMNILMHLLGI